MVGSICVCVSFIHIYHTPIQTQIIFYACFRPKKWCGRRTCSNARLHLYVCVIYTYLSYADTNTECILCVFLPEEAVCEEDLLGL